MILQAYMWISGTHLRPNDQISGVGFKNLHVKQEVWLILMHIEICPIHTSDFRIRKDW